MKHLKFTKNKQLLAIVLSVLLVGGCTDAPYHTVYDGEKVVFGAKESKHKHGRYEYWISDGSAAGWKLRSNRVFNIGDKIDFVKSN